MCKHQKNKNPYSEKEILEAWEKKWNQPGVVKDCVEKCYDDACSGVERNKDKNFKAKKHFIGFVQFTLAVECVLLIAALILGLFQGMEGELITGLVFFSIFQAGAFYATGKRIAVRKYQETWVRHSDALAKMREEMIRYLREMPPYKGLERTERDDMFVERFLKIQEDNQKKFTENMETKEESILDIPDKIRLQK